MRNIASLTIELIAPTELWGRINSRWMRGKNKSDWNRQHSCVSSVWLNCISLYIRCEWNATRRTQLVPYFFPIYGSNLQTTSAFATTKIRIIGDNYQLRGEIEQWDMSAYESQMYEPICVVRYRRSPNLTWQAEKTRKHIHFLFWSLRHAMCATFVHPDVLAACRFMCVCV